MTSWLAVWSGAVAGLVKQGVLSCRHSQTTESGDSMKS
jgi:hypothetical protein